MPKSYADLLREAREQVREVSASEADAARSADPRTVLLDVREELEWEAGHAVGALHVSKSYLEQDIEGAIPDRDRPIVIYCAGGIRSLFAGQILQEIRVVRCGGVLDREPRPTTTSYRALAAEWSMLTIVARTAFALCALIAKNRAPG